MIGWRKHSWSPERVCHLYSFSYFLLYLALNEHLIINQCFHVCVFLSFRVSLNGKVVLIKMYLAIVQAKIGSGHDEDVHLLPVTSSGLVNWTLTTTNPALCEDLDLTFYPFDTQTCDYQLSNWLHRSQDLKLLRTQTSFQEAFYKHKGAWSLVSTSVYDKTDGGTSYWWLLLKIFKMSGFS